MLVSRRSQPGFLGDSAYRMIGGETIPVAYDFSDASEIAFHCFSSLCNMCLNNIDHLLSGERLSARVWVPTALEIAVAVPACKSEIVLRQIASLADGNDVVDLPKLVILKRRQQVKSTVFTPIPSAFGQRGRGLAPLAGGNKLLLNPFPVPHAIIMARGVSGL